ncbi:MAG TPA: ComEC/Rec2 family competence protein [Polyangiaceae bacterium]|nr:ComEC/Rec2 family competence protein [Polyangiaceae bacterium]
MRVDPVLLLAVALAAGAPLALAPIEASAAIVACALLLWQRGARVLCVAALSIVAVQAWRARGELARAAAAHERVASALMPRARCELEAVVLRSPVALRNGGSTGERVDVSIVSGACEERRLPDNMVARLHAAPAGLARGDRLMVLADLGAVQLFHNPDVGDPHVRTALTSITASGVAVDVRILDRAAWPFVDRARAHVRARIDDTFAPRVSAYARALVLGETDLDGDDRVAFRKSGLAHLLAVSGTHLVLVVLSFARVLTMLFRRVRRLAERMDVERLAAGACLPLAWIYADFAGGGGSALRAAAMLSLAMLARAAGRRPCAIRCFAVSLGAGALLEPLAICDLSFALSVAATAGLLVAQSVRVSGTLSKAILSTMAATTACAPLFLSVEPELPLLGIVANLLAGPVGELAALPLCLAHAVLWWAPAAERGAAILAGGALEVVGAIAHASAESPFAIITLAPPTPAQLAAIACTAFAWWRFRRRGVIAMGVLLVVALELVARQAPRDALRITVLDVAQGDAILIDLPDGKLMLIDGGGMVGSPIDTGERAVLPVLRARRKKRIDIAVLSHPHPDHYLGWMTVLERVEVGEVWDSGLSEAERPDGSLARLLSSLRARGVRVRTSLCGLREAYGSAKVEVLAPCPSFDRNKSANDNSLVLRFTMGAHAALLTGDAEHDEEAFLVKEYDSALRADFLKVGHHGSRTSSTPAFLARVRPSTAAISCGVRNRFGHPHAEALAHLAGIDMLRTDRGGAIVWQSDGREIRFGNMVVDREP